MKLFFALGALFAFFAVAAGAFGAHALKARWTQEQLSMFEIAVRYQMYHALALMLTNSSVAGWLFTAGIILFSGSLYLLAMTSFKALGMITPIGGLLLLAGWSALIFGALK